MRARRLLEIVGTAGVRPRAGERESGRGNRPAREAGRAASPKTIRRRRRIPASQAKDMKVGTWVEFTDDDTAPSERAKLSWISPISSQVPVRQPQGPEGLGQDRVRAGRRNAPRPRHRSSRKCRCSIARSMRSSNACKRAAQRRSRRCARPDLTARLASCTLIPACDLRPPGLLPRDIADRRCHHESSLHRRDDRARRAARADRRHRQRRRHRRSVAAERDARTHA